MIYRILPLILFFVFSFKPLYTKEAAKNEVKSTDRKLVASKANSTMETKCKSFYAVIDANGFSLPNFEGFAAAFAGYEQLKAQGKIENEILTIIDFSFSSTKERMWVIDMKKNKVILKTLVSHGRNSGYEYATDFSNAGESYKSSLGFYITGETYMGKHGLSLRLDGLEQGVNHNARNRAVVVHGADYVSHEFVKNTGRLGRSHGCPAVPYKIHKELIDTIKGKSCIFIYHPSRANISTSKLVS